MHIFLPPKHSIYLYLYRYHIYRYIDIGIDVDIDTDMDYMLSSILTKWNREAYWRLWGVGPNIHKALLSFANHHWGFKNVISIFSINNYQAGKNPNFWQRSLLVSVWRNWHSHALLVGVKTGWRPVEVNLVIYSKITPILWPGNLSSGNLNYRYTCKCVKWHLFKLFIVLLFIWD